MPKQKIIIIGGGVAGLSTGIYGQMNGFDTQVIEMHTIPGGQCTAWKRGAYHFDYCLHWLVGTRKNVFNDIWKETHVITDKVAIVDSEVFSVTVDENMGKFYIYADIDRWQEYLLKMAPEDEKGIRSMCRLMKKGVKLEPFLNAPACRSWSDYLSLFFKMPGLLLMMVYYGNMPAKKYFQSLQLKNEKLRFFLMKMFGEQNFSALVFILMLGWYHDKNAGYLIGGSLPIADRMSKRYQELGGSIMLQTKVDKILVENNKATGVILSDGRVLRADLIISAADGHTTLYKMLSGKFVPPAFENAYKNWKLFQPFVQVSFGINAELQSENVMMAYWLKPFKMGNFLAREGYNIMNQSMHDPTLAPKGKTSIVLRFNSPWADWENISEKDYPLEKELILKDAITILEKHYPGSSAHIEVTDVSTPLTGNRITGVWKGAYEGFIPEGNVLTKSLPDRLKGLANFYMVGQWVFPGGGLPPAAQSGKWMIQTICKENKMKFIINTTNGKTI
ncbi:phytoene desaturase family protein [Flavihumibacter fluvii]|uniref:phytoene desaturase family protein n=1 Tax=Flavihumibacter fluvii TaxID=2838157 RepID=UPI001BDE3A06|nr:NAD(P)/FAD-dependent oxidoreductase [Flavihumibacter fluvii]ULQ51977.1 NAD(P)/FAD-dependent oxidoreductase [Flavihumibacter fluvii]